MESKKWEHDLAVPSNLGHSCERFRTATRRSDLDCFSRFTKDMSSIIFPSTLSHMKLTNDHPTNDHPAPHCGFPWADIIESNAK